MISSNKNEKLSLRFVLIDIYLILRSNFGKIIPNRKSDLVRSKKQRKSWESGLVNGLWTLPSWDPNF